MENIIEPEINEFLVNVDSNRKTIYKSLIYNELNKHLENEEYLNLSDKAKQLAFKIVARWVSIDLSRLAKSSIPEDNYEFIIEVITDVIFRVSTTSLEAGFEREEFNKIIKDESQNALGLAVSLLKDEDLITDKDYNNALQVIGLNQK